MVMRLPSYNQNLSTTMQKFNNLLKGEVPKVAVKQIDDVNDINFKDSKENHRVNLKYNKDSDRNIAHTIDNATGETVKKSLTDAQVDHLLRIERLKCLHLDEEV
ncbi:hypothetical protein [Natronospora cellulosivora (SeqCode)]